MMLRRHSNLVWLVYYTNFVLVFFSILALRTSISFAQSLPTAKKEEPQKPAQAVDPQLKKMLHSQQDTFRNFIKAINDGDRKKAALCLDLSELKNYAKDNGPELAYRLKEVIDRMQWVDFSHIPSDPEEADIFRFSDYAELDGADEQDARLITIVRNADGLWRFSSNTVANIEALYGRWSSRGRVENTVKAPEPFSEWLRNRFPNSLQKRHFLLPDYQWICLVVIVFLGFLADLITRLSLNFATRAWFRFAKSEEDYQAQKGLWKPVGLLAQALVWYSFTSLIGLPTTILLVLRVALKFLTVLAAIWTAFRLIDLLARFMKDKASLTETKFDDLLIPLISKSLKVLAVCIGLIMCAEAFDLPLTGLVGGLGLGGMAFVFASKDAISNLFGSLTVLVDRPFEVGDWIVTEGIEGTVDTVGFRSTRVRTFYNSMITVPNSLLTTATVDNMGKRQFRRVRTMLGVQYDTTPEQMDAFCEGIRELIRRHPYTRKDYYHVYFNQFSGSSLDILLYCFFDCPDWSIELRERHRLFNDIIRLAQSLHVSFAFPTQTLHMYQEDSAAVDLSAELNNPLELGIKQAAKIAGPLMPKDKRPGTVTFDNTLGAAEMGDDDGGE